MSAVDPLQEHLVSLVTPRSFEAEQYRGLRHILVERAQESGRLSVVAVSSPSMGDGKTTTTINLAGALAQSADVRVLLIDADLRRPSVSKRLGIDGRERPGLVEAILDETLGLDDVVQRHPRFNLFVLPAGRGSDLPYEALKSPRVGQLFEDARARYDYVLVDTPPLVPLADCRIIEKWVDAFIVVVAAHKTPRRLVEDGLNVLDPARVLGIVFNRDEQAMAANYYGYYAYGGYGGNRAEAWRARWTRRLTGAGAAVRRRTRRRR
jgi:capsular exopolysaccharide synthesis family protein